MCHRKGSLMLADADSWPVDGKDRKGRELPTPLKPALMRYATPQNSSARTRIHFSPHKYPVSGPALFIRGKVTSQKA